MVPDDDPSDPAHAPVQLSWNLASIGLDHDLGLTGRLAGAVFWDQVQDLFPLEPPPNDPSIEAVDEQDLDPASRRNIAATLDVLCELLEHGIESTISTTTHADLLAVRVTESFFCQIKWHRVVDALIDVLRKDNPLGPVLLVCITCLLHLASFDHSVYRRLSKCPDPQLIRSLSAAIWPVPGHLARAASLHHHHDQHAAPEPAQEDYSQHKFKEHLLDMVPPWPHELLAASDTGQPESSRDAAAVAQVDALHAQISALQADLRVKAVQLFYLLCKVQLMHHDQLSAISASFINHLFDLVEETRDQQDEFFNYHVILLLLALNEQYMVSSLAQGHAPESSQPNTGPHHTRTRSNSKPRANLVINVLRLRLHASKTFSENIVFMLNRTSHDVEEDMCIQLLILKLLYVLFTTPDLALFFYTNDLKVLLDIFIREIQDLPEERDTLRHTYLRVLHPLMLNTQLRANSYKQPEIRSLLLRILAQQQFREIDPATIRLVNRCLASEWCLVLAERMDESGTPVSASTQERSNTAPHHHVPASGGALNVSEHVPTIRTNSTPNPLPLPVVQEGKLAMLPTTQTDWGLDTEAMHKIQATAHVVRERANSRGDLNEQDDAAARAHAEADAVAQKVAHAELNHEPNGAEHEELMEAPEVYVPGSLSLAPTHSDPGVSGGRHRALSTSGLRYGSNGDSQPSEAADCSPFNESSLHPDSSGNGGRPFAPRALSASGLHTATGHMTTDAPNTPLSFDAGMDPMNQVAPAPAGLGRRASVLGRQTSTTSTRRRRASVSSADEWPGIQRRSSKILPPKVVGGKEVRQANTRPSTPMEPEDQEPDTAQESRPVLAIPAHVATDPSVLDVRSASPFPDSVFFPPTPPMDARAVRGRRGPPPPPDTQQSIGLGTPITMPTRRTVSNRAVVPPPINRENKPTRSPSAGHVSASPPPLPSHRYPQHSPYPQPTPSYRPPPRPPKATKPTRLPHRPPPAPPTLVAPSESSTVSSEEDFTDSPESFGPQCPLPAVLENGGQVLVGAPSGGRMSISTASIASAASWGSTTTSSSYVTALNSGSGRTSPSPLTSAPTMSSPLVPPASAPAVARRPAPSPPVSTGVSPRLEAAMNPGTYRPPPPPPVAGSTSRDNIPRTTPLRRRPPPPPPMRNN